MSYTPTQVHVFQNGIRLVDGTDYTATNGSSITLTVGASTNDQIVVVSYATVEISDAVPASSGGTFSGNVVVNDTITTTNITATNITTTNIKATGETNSRSATGIAAAWVNFNGTGTVAIRDSNGNVSSITDNATGDFSANLTNAFGSTSYVGYSGNGDGANSGDVWAVINKWSNCTASLFRAHAYTGAFSTSVDSEYGNYSMHGDLA